MDAMWTFFEEMDEIVFVSDMETYELIYMNRRLREALGWKEEEAYRGRPCYEVLQGYHEPCPFCTNIKLSPGQFVSWSHWNPILSRRFLIKDSMVETGGKKYRVEIAIDAEQEADGRASCLYARNEAILNECLQEIFATTYPQEAIKRLLSHIGRTFSCDRVYVFELCNGAALCNTYEWCADGVKPQRELLQNVPLSSVDWWLQLFENGRVTVIDDLESIRLRYPESYAILKPQDISSLAAGAIRADGRFAGLLGVDNPDPEMMGAIKPLLNVIGYFVASLLRQRDLIAKLHELSYHDELTGALNRNALAEYGETMQWQSMGVIYFDVTGLKNANDSLGHAAGDEMLRHCYALICRAMGPEHIYRTGGDEFIALCPNCSCQTFEDTVHELRELIRRDIHHTAMGFSWAETGSTPLEELIVQADCAMYRDKRDYYEQINRRLGTDQWRESAALCGEGGSEESAFRRFLNANYCNVEAFFRSVSQDNNSSYFYLGDMQRNVFFISDNMRDDFGFQDNTVPNLLALWAKRISTSEHRELYWHDISDMLESKRTIHDLRYRVKDVHGVSRWIRCYGQMVWNEEKSRPIFFSGRIACQDRSFVADPITSLPRENASFRELNRLRIDSIPTVLIGFGLNSVRILNSTKGRRSGDLLMCRVAEALMERLSGEMSFYRLEGARFLAIVNPASASQDREALVARIRSVVESCYRELQFPAANPCSFGVMEYPSANLLPEDAVESLVSLIRLTAQEPSRSYLAYSAESVRRIREDSDMALRLAGDVSHGMENFRIAVQPMVSAREENVVGGEALLRWRFQGEDVPPEVFIPLLEKNGSIRQVGRWVAEQAVCTCVRARSYAPEFFVTFNVSLPQLLDDGFLSFLREILEKYRLDSSGLVAELTESSLDEHPEKLTGFVNGCRTLGVRVALDDFGSGCSSMRMLLQCPSSIIKLDRSLIREAMGSQEKLSFLRSIVFACHQFGKTVCVEGVESEQQNSIVRGMGCDTIQGFFHHRPLELRELYGLLGGPASGGEKDGGEA